MLAVFIADNELFHLKIPLKVSTANVFIYKQILKFVTVFRKTDRMDTNAEIHFLPVDESHIHALFRDTKHLRLDGRVCFYRRLFPMLSNHEGAFPCPCGP